jgi:hypothetical protein
MTHATDDLHLVVPQRFFVHGVGHFQGVTQHAVKGCGANLARSAAPPDEPAAPTESQSHRLVTKPWT